MRSKACSVVGVLAVAGLFCGCSRSGPSGGTGTGQPGESTTAAAVKLSAPKVETAAINAASAAKAQAMINGGVQYLLSQRDAEGGWSASKGTFRCACTAIVLKALLQHPDFSREAPVVKEGIRVLLSFRQKDGGIYDAKEGVSSYSTAVAIMALAAAHDPRHRETIRDAIKFLEGLQVAPGQESPDGKVVDESDPNVGGVGYGKNGVPNLSVLGYAMDAWHEAGMEPNAEAMKRTVGFLTRLQNRSESNPLTFAREGANDGGFTYDLRHSKAGEGPEGKGMRSYGTMTYVGFKSMLYAGVAKDDDRVKAAYDWIRKFWRLDSNPNMPEKRSQEGVYYYYQVFAKALRAWGEDEIADFRDAKVKHNWRQELIGALGERVRKDGSWVNAAMRWEEDSPVLATSYCVLALQESVRK